jgi:hypothetical protein
MLNLPTGEVGARTPHYLLGGLLAFVVVSAAVAIAWVWVKRPASARDDVLVFLMGAGVLFVATTAVGRVPLGVLGGTAPRYLTLMFPMWFAVYLAAGSFRTVMPMATACVWLLAVGPYAEMPPRPLAEWPGTFGLTNDGLDEVRIYGTSKAAWAEVYLATGSLEAAQAAVPRPVHPDPTATRLDDKLHFLRERKLSFFSGEPNRRDYLPWLADETFSCPALRSSPHACR